VSSPTSFEALAQRILEGSASLQVRAAAARGALPLPRAALVRLFLHLREDPDTNVRNDAHASLEALGPEQAREVLGDPDCPPEVLLHFAPIAARDEKLAEILAFHPKVPDEALSALATRGNASVIELVLVNQQRLVSAPALLDRLTMNPALRADQRGRILDLLGRVSRMQETPADSAEAHAEEASPEGEIEDTARLLDVDVGELLSSSEIEGGEEFENSEDAEIRSVYRRILTLNTAQKAILAMKGGREERVILVRDTNKVVALSVLKNPRLTEQEVEKIAMMRNVSDEVLRHVGNNREWAKSYQVVNALVRNPKTPPGVSSNFIPRLVNRDLKQLASDKNVPELIRRMAKKTLDTRTQQTAASFRKK
jgi:hypothetical protein